MIQDDDPKLTSIYSGLRKKTLSWPLYILHSGGWSQADLYIFRIQEDDPKLTYIYILDSLCSGSNRVSPFICSGLRRMTSSWPLYVQDSGGWPQVDFCMYRIHYDDPKLTSKCSGSRRMTPICWPLHVYDPRGWPQVDFYIFRIQEDDPKLTSIYSGSRRMTPSWPSAMERCFTRTRSGSASGTGSRASWSSPATFIKWRSICLPSPALLLSH